MKTSDMLRYLVIGALNDHPDRPKLVQAADELDEKAARIAELETRLHNESVAAKAFREIVDEQTTRIKDNRELTELWKKRAIEVDHLLEKSEAQNEKLQKRSAKQEEHYNKTLDLIHERAGIARDGLAFLFAFIDEALENKSRITKLESKIGQLEAELALTGLGIAPCSDYERELQDIINQAADDNEALREEVKRLKEKM